MLEGQSIECPAHDHAGHTGYQAERLTERLERLIAARGQNQYQNPVREPERQDANDRDLVNDPLRDIEQVADGSMVGRRGFHSIWR
jgi:hypothetical protein